MSKIGLFGPSFRVTLAQKAKEDRCYNSTEHLFMFDRTISRWSVDLKVSIQCVQRRKEVSALNKGRFFTMMGKLETRIKRCETDASHNRVRLALLTFRRLRNMPWNLLHGRNPHDSPSRQHVIIRTGSERVTSRWRLLWSGSE